LTPIGVIFLTFPQRQLSVGEIFVTNWCHFFDLTSKTIVSWGDFCNQLVTIFDLTSKTVVSWGDFWEPMVLIFQPFLKGNCP
jgi:hypothetical protein